MVFSNSWWIAAVSRRIKCNYGRPHSSPLCGEKSPNFPIYGGFSSSREKCHIMLKFEKFTFKRRNKTSFKRDFTRRIIEGSNPSLSAIFFAKKNGERSRKASLHAATAALHSKGAAFSSHLHKNKEALLVKTLPAPFHYAAASRFSRL